MMKVLFIVPSLRRAGAETQVVDLVNALHAPDIECQLVCFQPDLSQRDRLSATVGFHHVPRRSKYDFSVIRGIARIIDQGEIDVVHCTLEFSVLVGWLAIRRARRKPRLIAAIHTTLIRDLKEQLHHIMIYQWILRQCDRIVFVCRKQADFWLERYPFLAKNSTVIHNGIDLARFSGDFDALDGDFNDRLAVPADAYIISCIAGLRPEKRHDLLLKAFARLDANAHLYLAGDGALRSSVESLVDQLGLRDRVHFLGNIEDVRPLLRATDITVLASTAVETFSIAMLESMAMGVPMVAPDIGGLSEAIVHDQTGWLYPAGDVDRLADLLAEGARDRAKLRTMGASAHRIVEQYFSRDIMAELTSSLLRSVAGAATQKLPEAP